MLAGILILLASFIVNSLTIIFYRKQLEKVRFTSQNEITELKKELKKERAITRQLMRHSD